MALAVFTCFLIAGASPAAAITYSSGDVLYVA